MKWKDSDDSPQLEDQTGDDFDDEDDYPHWEKPKRSAFSEKLFKKIELPFVLIGGVLVVLIIFFLISVSGKNNEIEVSRIEALEKRLGIAEDRLFKVEGGEGNIEQIAQQSKRIDQLQEKVERLEASIGPRLDKLTSAVTTMQKGKSSTTVTEAVQKQYHQVRAGESLYSIGRLYGVGVEDLRRLNNFSSDSIIHPGQKIVVGSSKNR